jgi:hypothetical protein
MQKRPTAIPKDGEAGREMGALLYFVAASLSLTMMIAVAMWAILIR